MQRGSKSRIKVDALTSQAFVENLERFSAELSSKEKAVLSALLREAMDPWSRSLIDPPPHLTTEEIVVVDAAARSEPADL